MTENWRLEMKRNLFAALITAGLLLSLTGCQLAKVESGSQDRLVGAFITTEYLDLMDMEAYLNDHLDEVTKGEEYGEMTLLIDSGNAK